MGTKLQNAADALQRMARDYQAVIDLAGELGRIGDIEAARDTTQRQLEQTRIDLSAEMERLGGARESLLKATDEAAEKLRSADAERTAMMDLALEEAQSLRNRAADEADQMRRAGRAEAEATVKAAKDAAEAMRVKDASAAEERLAELAELSKKIDEARETLAQRNAALELIEKRLAEVHEGVATLKKGTS